MSSGDTAIRSQQEILGPGYAVPGPEGKGPLALSGHIFSTLRMPGPQGEARRGLGQSWTL